jgi:hypothetical protein
MRFSNELSDKLQLLLRSPELVPEALKESGQVIPHHPLGWANVDFNKPILLGVEPYLFDDGKPYKTYVGIMSRPQYNYKSWQATTEQSAKIKELCLELVKEPTIVNSTALYDYLQTCKETNENTGNATAGS